jgi:hypothetical protein
MTHVESLRRSRSKVYRRTVAATNGLRRGKWAAALLPCLPVLFQCTSVDPGPDFVVQETVFDANFFYCHVEPQLIFQYNCGPGDPTMGDPSNGCHFNPSAVSGMALIDHPAIDCGGGDVPLDLTQVGSGSPATSNLQAVSLEMSTDYTTSAIYTRPSDASGCPPPAHPRCVFSQTNNPDVGLLLAAWAAK